MKLPIADNSGFRGYSFMMLYSNDLVVCLCGSFYFLSVVLRVVFSSGIRYFQLESETKIDRSVTSRRSKRYCSFERTVEVFRLSSRRPIVLSSDFSSGGRAEILSKFFNLSRIPID
jgi:hypothetical protein